MSNKCKKCNYIIFGKITKYHFLILLNGLVCSIIVIIERQSKFFGEENLHPIIYVIQVSLGSSLSFIFFIIYKKRNKIKNNEANPLFIRQSNKKEITLKKNLCGFY